MLMLLMLLILLMLLMLLMLRLSTGGGSRPGQPGSPPDFRFVGRYVHDGLPCRGRKGRLDVRGDGNVR